MYIIRLRQSVSSHGLLRSHSQGHRSWVCLFGLGTLNWREDSFTNSPLDTSWLLFEGDRAVFGGVFGVPFAVPHLLFLTGAPPLGMTTSDIVKVSASKVLLRAAYLSKRRSADTGPEKVVRA